MLELAALERRQLHAHAAERVVETAPQERNRVLNAIGIDPLDAELLREPRVEAEQGLVRDAAAQPRVRLSVDRPGIDHTLELGHAEARSAAQLLQDLWMRQLRRSRERRKRALELP